MNLWEDSLQNLWDEGDFTPYERGQGKSTLGGPSASGNFVEQIPIAGPARQVPKHETQPHTSGASALPGITHQQADVAAPTGYIHQLELVGILQLSKPLCLDFRPVESITGSVSAIGVGGSF